MSKEDFKLSVVVPIFNEAQGLPPFHTALIAILKHCPNYELIYINDGSSDDSADVLQTLATGQPCVHVVSLSRNFGKEYALTAGIAQASGDAVIMIDADGQHPVDLLPNFISRWQNGADLVVGVRSGATSLCARIFYSLFNRTTGETIIPNSTDYRLLDRQVVDEFLKLPENNRITRGLIDWLGFKRDVVEFTANDRLHGQASYSAKDLRRLALNSFVSLSSVPLFLFGYIGIVITAASGILGVALLIEQVILGDPLAWHFTGTALLGTLTLFLIGIVLMSQGMIALYISHIHTQSKHRPLYIIDTKRSIRLKK